jgi:tetratricopeptide (TPR) repeat protein
MKSGAIFKFFFLFILLLVNEMALAANKNPVPSKECLRLFDLGIKESSKGHYDTALEYLTKAELLAEKVHWKDKLFVIKFNIAANYANLSNYGEALGYYKDALKYAREKDKGKNDRLMALNNIALIYSFENDNIIALEYALKAYKEAKEVKSDYLIVVLGTNLYHIYALLGNSSQAKKYLMEVRDIPKNKEIEQKWQINYADLLISEGKIAEAEKIGKKLLNEVEVKKAAGCYICIAKTLTDLYEQQNKIELAIFYSKKGLQSTIEKKDRIELYSALSRLYFKKNEFVISSQYKDSVIIEKDALRVLVNSGLFESNKIKLRVQDYRNELQAKTQRQQLERNFFTAIIALSIVITVFLYFSLRHKITRQRQEKTIINLKLEQKSKDLDTIKAKEQLKREKLKNTIAEKNRELSAKALYLSIRNELIEKSINSMSLIPEISKNASVSNHIKSLKTHLKSDAGWEDFISHFEKVNPTFIKMIKETHPELNGKDIRFVCCVFLNLDIKEISNIFNVTYNAANKRKQRVRQKMGFDEDASLYEYLLKLDNSNLTKTVKI